mmetsp:Transcript_10786/g.20176  ORF Transcript_10786/g.20176 Transcript_10786/m.20176 type:complete len:803 (+) Transcript_10786:398-2806(+)
MSTSSSSTLEDMRHSSALQDLSSEALAMHPPTLKTNPHGRHASWADHKFTSDGDILTLDSPRPSGDRDGFMDGHVRSLSGQLFGMNLSPDNSITYSPDQEPHEFTESEDRETSVHSPKETSSFNHNISTFPTQEASGRKHRRGCSEGKTNPVVAHRRMDSGGNVAFINRQVEHTQPMPSSHSGQQNGTSSFRYHHYPIPLQQQSSREHERKASPSYDQSQRYGQVQPFIPHRSNQLPQHRSSSYPSRLSHQYPSPRQDTYDYYREDEMYRRSYPQGVPPRYQSYRGGYPVYGAMDSGISQHRYPSPHNGSFPDEVGSHNANTGPYASYNRYPQSHPSQRDDNPYYPPPRGGTQYPVQYANDANERRYAALPQHPLADNGAYCPYAPPHYRRQTSHNSLGTGSDGRIETDENLFAGESRAIMSSSPRKSPQLFDLALHGKPIPSHISSSPPEFVSYSGGLSEDGRGSQGPTFPPIPPGENRIRTASSDSNIKQFIKAVEVSQAHKRGESTDSFIFNDSLFGENILEPNGLDSNVNGEVDPVDSLAPIPVSTGEAISSGPPVASINIPPATSSHYEFNQYDDYPDITRSHSISPPYSNSSTHGEISKASTLPRLDSALSKAYSTSSNSTTMESSDSKPIGRQITGKVSKRARRKCSVENCQNRVVQGGLCIAHGAKRKLCGHPGCNKHVKKAGMCSAHGPPRKLCEYEGCNKVAVQGGRCISHGAKKKLCSVEDCKKQAILGGMCKKHHDEESGRGHMFCQSVYTDEPCGESPEPRNIPTHTRGLSIFTDNDIQEKIIKREINL